MKSFAAATLAILTLSTFALAAPTAEALPKEFEPITREEILKKLGESPETTLQKRTPGGVNLCTGANWSGQCGYAVQPLNQCIFLTSPWLNGVGSFGPDRGATCYLSNNNNCNEAVAGVSYPGNSNVRGIPGLSNSITTFMCE